jgi:hypothetical protein
MMDKELRFRRNGRGLREDISWESRKRDWRSLWSENFGGINAPADGLRFLGGKT